MDTETALYWCWAGEFCAIARSMVTVTSKAFLPSEDVLKSFRSTGVVEISVFQVIVSVGGEWAPEYGWKGRFSFYIRGF